MPRLTGASVYPCSTLLIVALAFSAPISAQSVPYAIGRCVANCDAPSPSAPSGSAQPMMNQLGSEAGRRIGRGLVNTDSGARSSNSPEVGAARRQLEQWANEGPEGSSSSGARPGFDPDGRR